MNLQISEILSDPITYGIAFALFAALYLIVRYIVPAIKKERVFDRYGTIINFLGIAARAAEQARKQGDFNSFAAMFGVKIDLADDKAVRDAVINWVQKQLIANFSWGYKVKIGEIMVLLEDLIRQGAHKGQKHPLEEIGAATPEQILQYIPVGQLQAAIELYDHLTSGGGKKVAIPQLYGPLGPGLGRRSKGN
jgi:hypothetical protein